MSIKEINKRAIKIIGEYYNKKLAELRKMDVCRSDNAPIGDYAEWLVCRKLGLRMAENKSLKAVDAVSKDFNTSYQIKARRLNGESSSRIISVLKKGYDKLVIVYFNKDCIVHRAWMFDRSEVDCVLPQKKSKQILTENENNYPEKAIPELINNDEEFGEILKSVEWDKAEKKYKEVLPRKKGKTMPRPKNLTKLLAGLTDAELDQLREMVKENPEVTELKRKRTALLQEVEVIDARIAELTGTGRKKPGKTVSKPVATATEPKPKGKPGRKPKTVEAAATTPKRRGRPAKVTNPDSISGEATSAKPGRKPMTLEQKAKLSENLAKARAAKASKKSNVISGEPMPKAKRQKRVIVDNDLIKPAK